MRYISASEDGSNVGESISEQTSSRLDGNQLSRIVEQEDDLSVFTDQGKISNTLID